MTRKTKMPAQFSLTRLYHPSGVTGSEHGCCPCGCTPEENPEVTLLAEHVEKLDEAVSTLQVSCKSLMRLVEEAGPINDERGDILAEAEEAIANAERAYNS